MPNKSVPCQMQTRPRQILTTVFNPVRSHQLAHTRHRCRAHEAVASYSPDPRIAGKMLNTFAGRTSVRRSALVLAVALPSTCAKAFFSIPTPMPSPSTSTIFGITQQNNKTTTMCQ